LVEERKEIKVLRFLYERKEATLSEISSSLGISKRELNSAVKVLKKNYVIDLDNGEKLRITELGSLAMEKDDIKLVFGYDPKKRVPDYLAFKFFLTDGNFSGEIASSYREFLEVVKKVDSRSLLFHLYRGDFDKWFLDVFKDKKVANKISSLRNKSLPPNKIRDRLVKIVEKRLNEIGGVEANGTEA